MRRVKGLLREQQPFFVNGQQPDEKICRQIFVEWRKPEAGKGVPSARPYAVRVGVWENNGSCGPKKIP